MPGNGLFFEKSNDELIWPPGGRRTLGGGRASWLVPFDVIIHYTKQNPRHGKEGEETGRKSERNPPLLKVPPPESNDMRKERKRLTKRKEGREEGRRRKEEVSERKKIIKSY